MSSIISKQAPEIITFLDSEEVEEIGKHTFKHNGKNKIASEALCQCYFEINELVDYYNYINCVLAGYTSIVSENNINRATSIKRDYSILLGKTLRFRNKLLRVLNAFYLHNKSTDFKFKLGGNRNIEVFIHKIEQLN